jgi:hypothetical protein
MRNTWRDVSPEGFLPRRQHDFPRVEGNIPTLAVFSLPYSRYNRSDFDYCHSEGAEARIEHLQRSFSSLHCLLIPISPFA